MSKVHRDGHSHEDEVHSDAGAQYLHGLITQLANLSMYNSEMSNDLKLPYRYFEQIQRMIDYNNFFGRVEPVNDKCEVVATGAELGQKMNDLVSIFVSFDTLEKTALYNYELIMRAHERLGLDCGIKLPKYFYEFESMRPALYAITSKIYYKPGIYIIRINMLDNWTPHSRYGLGNVENLRSMAMLDHIPKLAVFEPMGAIALQDPSLFELFDGKKLPHIELAGLKYGDDVLNFHREKRGDAKYLRFNRLKVNKDHSNMYSRPTIIDSVNILEFPKKKKVL